MFGPSATWSRAVQYDKSCACLSRNDRWACQVCLKAWCNLGDCRCHLPTLQTEDCVEAHTNVDVVVNIEEVRALLASRLPLVFAGASVKQAALPWPPP